MKPVSPVLPGFDVTETVFAQNQPEYEPLPAVRIDAPGSPVLTRWKLSAEERQRLAEGADLYLWIWTHYQPLQPVALEVKTAAEIMGREASGAVDPVLNADFVE